MRQQYNRCFTILVIVSIIFLNSCVSIAPVYYDEDKRNAAKTVERFQQLYNAKKFNEIFDLFTMRQQKLLNKKQFKAALRELHSEAGKVNGSRLVKTKIELRSSHRVVNSFYETRFENDIRLEEFDVLVDDGLGKIDHYGQPEKLPQ